MAIFQHSFSGTVVAAIGERSEPRFTLLDSPLSLAVSFEWFEPIMFHLLLNIDFLLGLAESFSHVILAVINAQIMSRDSDPFM